MMSAAGTMRMRFATLSGTCGTGGVTNASLLSNSFVDPTDLDGTPGNWSLITGSPLIGAGTSTGAPSVDRAGNARPSPPSIGAYELGG